MEMPRETDHDFQLDNESYEEDFPWVEAEDIDQWMTDGVIDPTLTEAWTSTRYIILDESGNPIRETLSIPLTGQDFDIKGMLPHTKRIIQDAALFTLQRQTPEELFEALSAVLEEKRQDLEEVIPSGHVLKQKPRFGRFANNKDEERQTGKYLLMLGEQLLPRLQDPTVDSASFTRYRIKAAEILAMTKVAEYGQLPNAKQNLAASLHIVRIMTNAITTYGIGQEQLRFGLTTPQAQQRHTELLESTRAQQTTADELMDEMQTHFRRRK